MSDPTQLPADLPVPVDDGAANHLKGSKIPEDIDLLATSGERVALGRLNGTTILFGYPLTGRPGHMDELPENWDSIPGARGCTPHTCGFRDRFEELKRHGADHVFGMSTQSSEYQQELAKRLHLPFPVLSDESFALTQALNLPTFVAANKTLLKRIALVIDDGRITHVFYPVFPPDQNASEVFEWLKEHPKDQPRRPCSIPEL